MPIGPLQIAGVFLGGSLALLGLWILIALRPERSTRGLRIPFLAPDRRASEPTRLFCSFLLLIVGYHAAVWVFPERFTHVQLDREFWYIWLLIGIVACVLAAVIDRIEGNPPEGGDRRG